MKKLMLSLLCMSTVLYSNAQLRVNPGGEVTIGSTPASITKKLMVDGEASVKTTFDIVNLNNTNSGWGGKLRFMPSNGSTPNHIITDNGQNEMIIHTGFNAANPTLLTVAGELNVSKTAKVRTSLDIVNLDNTGTQWGGQLRFMPNSGSSPNHVIIDKGQNEMIIYAGLNASNPTDFKIISGTNTFTGYTNMAGGSNLSDKRLKQNITPINYGLKTLMQLNPVSYEWKANELSTITSKEELPKQFKGTQVGFIAQEVEAIIPEVVKEGVGGYRALEYHTLTAIIVQAMKEQQTIIETQKLAIEDLNQQVEQLKNQTNTTNVQQSEKVFSLEQNRPNPFATNTSIKYSSPENAQLLITNLEGKTMQSIALDAGENKTIEVTAQKLQNGIYLYSLVVDGSIKLSKRFVVAK